MKAATRRRRSSTRGESVKSIGRLLGIGTILTPNDQCSMQCSHIAGNGENEAARDRGIRWPRHEAGARGAIPDGRLVGQRQRNKKSRADSRLTLDRQLSAVSL